MASESTSVTTGRLGFGWRDFVVNAGIVCVGLMLVVVRGAWVGGGWPLVVGMAIGLTIFGFLFLGVLLGYFGLVWLVVRRWPMRAWLVRIVRLAPAGVFAVWLAAGFLTDYSREDLATAMGCSVPASVRELRVARVGGLLVNDEMFMFRIDPGDVDMLLKGGRYERVADSPVLKRVQETAKRELGFDVAGWGRSEMYAWNMLTEEEQKGGHQYWRIVLVSEDRMRVLACSLDEN